MNTITHSLRFIKSSLWPLLVVFFRILSSLAVNKLFAVFYGPAGITLLAHFQNLLSIITTIPGDGINRGMIKYMATESGEQALQKKEQESYQKYFTTGLWLNIVVFIVTMLVLLLAKQQYFALFVVDYSFPDKLIWFTVFIIASLFLIINFFLLSVILSKQLLRIYALISIAGSVFTIVFAGIGVLHFTITNALLVFLLGQSCAFLFSTGYLAKKKIIAIQNKFVIKRKDKATTDLGKFILMALSIVLFDKMVDFFVRM
ncbi:MAG: hypothetical protein IIA88_03950 [Bacteroidetes bacterium]|nr:hypothetical protein [Bacteroidota bacterium]